ncbi:XdhC family protein [Plantactinospora sonchi]|uniref:XdhC family protein n=1 Tax=Plantactinospora sonchi TaxID=1544735 RepID=A0ABU7RQK0_9ACTN
MLELATDLARWARQGRRYAVATVIAVSGSAPRQPGAALAVDADGAALGTVSGGCVEGAVYELCREALVSGRSSTHRFGYSDESAFAVGLSCGGVIDVFVQPMPPLPDVGPDGSVTVARVVEGPDRLLGRAVQVRGGRLVGTFGIGALDRAVATARGTSLRRIPACESGPEVVLFVETTAPPPRMLVFGALDVAAELGTVGAFLGYRVTVCDPRPVFATAQRFPGVEVVVDWPHRYLDGTAVDDRTVICVLTHDPKFDVPLLRRALRMPAAYVGAMGSRRTHEERLRLLRAAGVEEDALSRLRSPVGLDLAAVTPAETALSIGAEIVARLRGGSGLPLTGLDGPIHRVGRENAGVAL